MWSVVAGAIAVAVRGCWLAGSGHALGQPAKERAKAPGDDSLGYTYHCMGELGKIGQISPQDFARMFKGQAKYLDKLTWDPTTAKFWADFDLDPSKLPPGRRFGRSDFRLNQDELARFKESGFVVSERMAA